MKYIVSFSGGHSSALVAIEAVRKHGKDDVILLNHDISSQVEHQDIKRFKNEVAEYLNIPITYANADDFENNPPLRVVRDKLFISPTGRIMCTYFLKTQPFEKYMRANFPATPTKPNNKVTVLVGFEKTEYHRIQRRNTILSAMGYMSEFPLAFWNRTIYQTEEIGIERPVTYKIERHANCMGCLKAGIQHWYVVFILHREIFDDAVAFEKETGFHIHRDFRMEELIGKFESMKCSGIVPDGVTNSHKFWAKVKKILAEHEEYSLPCECSESFQDRCFESKNLLFV
ncbi:MAG: hypothetical protein LBL62_00420 [Planctomycetaceae bacterium]|jgi:hypothetical protein|nr:hypothetical protein [Planctomycetaceae bacterium]